MGKWHKTSEKLPKEDYSVVAIASGEGENVVFDHALVLAEYCGNDEWIIDGYPQVVDPDILWWKDVKLPKELRNAGIR